MEPTTSRNTSTGQVSRWATIKMRTLVNAHQSLVFVAHNVAGYLLMLAVMVYNAHLLLAVVFGMMLGYFLFGTKLTRLQMQCFSTKRVVICTPECDDTDRCNTEKCSWEVCEGKLCKELDALELQQTDTTLSSDLYSPSKYSHLPLTETTPPLLGSPVSSEAELLSCRTRTCIQPSHYFPAAGPSAPPATCYYGAKRCPSKVAKAKAKPGACHHAEPDKEDSPGVEDAQLLRTERQGCCKKQEPPPAEEKCCKTSQETTAVVHDARARWSEDRSGDSIEARQDQAREDSPQITCCHNAKPTPTESQEQIIKDL